MADAPRKITIKLKPVGVKVAPAAAAAPAAPAPAPAAAPVEPPAPPAAPVVATETAASMEDLTPIAETALTPEEVAQQAKRQTSRIELPPEITQQPMNADGETQTIKLKPISATAQEAPENPQAAKSKTARIELDAVLGGIQTNTPLANTTQKTIKLKRVAPVGGVKPTTSSAPMSAVPPVASASGGSEATTIKLKRPGGGLTLKKDTPPPAPVEPELESLDTLESLDDLPAMSESAPVNVEESAAAKAFTIVAIVAAAASIIVTLIVCGILQKHAASPDGSPATGNTLHALPFERLF